MKNLFLSLFLLLITAASQAKSYYFSSVSGSDSYTSTQAQSSATPWKTISKLNSVFSSFAAGDSVLFKRGETFYGAITPIVSGIIFSAYGTGTAKPVLSGLTTLSTWTSAGTNLWKSAAITAASVPAVFTINGAAIPYGRYPNTGYNYFESHSGSTSIIDNQLPSSPVFTGAELVMRFSGFELNRYPITSHSGTNITFSGNSKTITDNYGYFIQNHLAALDLQNEWCFDKTAKAITVYSTASPTGAKVSTIDNICTINGVSSITFKNLAFEGANINAFNIKNASNIIIDGCDISNSGLNGILAVSVSNSLFQNCRIYNSYDDGIILDEYGCSGITIRSNTIIKSGAVPGMGPNGNSLGMDGIAVSGPGHTVEYNTVDSSGYSAINYARCNDLTIKNNVVNTYCFIKHDGGGIYTWNNDLNPIAYTNIKITGNIVLNGIGAPEGTRNLTNYDVDGIMMDDNASNATITDNTIANVKGHGIYIHNNFNMTVLRNTSYNNGTAQVDFTHNPAYVNGVLAPYTTPLRNITFKHNILFSKTALQPVLNLYTIRNDIDSMGVIDSNYFARPLYDDWTHLVTRNINGALVNESYDLPGWKATFKPDQASKKSARDIPAYTINSLTGSNLVTYGQFTSDIAGLKFFSSNGNQTVTWDNTSKITGTGSVKISFPTVVSNVYSLLYSSVGAVSSSKNYVLRFSTMGTTDTGKLKVYIRFTGSPYATLVPVQVKTFGKTKTNHEFFFAAPEDATDAVYAIEVKQSSGTTYIDNIEFYEVNATITDPDDHIRFEYNPTNVVKTVALDANYIGVDSTLYSGSLTLQPYSSKILIKDTARRDINNLALSLATSPVSCFGGNTNIVIAASGGTAPYTGTGTYSVNAGKGSLKLSFPAVITNKYTLIYSAIGAISAAKNYVIRFTTLGTTDTGTVRAYFRQTASPYARLAAIQSKSFGKSRTNHSFLFNAPTSEATASFVLEVKQNSGTTYIDNIEVYEATATGALIGTNLFSNGQFTSTITGLTFYSDNSNHTAAWDSTSKITNNYTYIVKDAAGASKDTIITVSQPAAPLAVSATAGTISVYGGNTTVTVTATGGTAPYTGAGSFTVKAGTYTYTVTDAKGCYASTVITVVQPPATLTASAIGSNINCFGGTANVVVSAYGGSAPYTGTGTYEVSAGIGSLKVSATSPVAGSYTYLYAPVGALGAGKNYLLRFSTLGTSAAGNLRAGVRMTNSPWTTVTTLQTAVFGNTRTDHQFIFTGLTAQSAASFLIQIDQASGTTYIDNVAFFECTAAGTIIGYNQYPDGQFQADIAGVSSWSANSNHTITWDNTTKISDTYYFTVADAIGSTSTVAANTIQPAAPLSVSVSAGTISVFGGSTSVTVAASGGTAPYTGIGTFAGVLAGTYTYTVTDANGCTATASVNITQPASSFTLTTTATPSPGGSISKSPNATSYAPGTVVTLTATAASGYVFTGWSGDAAGTAVSVTVTMSGNKSVTANFAPVYTLTTTATPTAGGSISKSPSATSYTSGTVVTLTAAAASGYVFTGWSGDATGTAASVTVTMSGNKSVTANFAAAYTLTTTATPAVGGSISRNPSTATYAAGSVVTLTATPAIGYIFTGWSGDATGTSASVTVTMNSNKSVTANFQAASYTLTTATTPAAGGSVSRSPNATSYAAGTDVTLTATAASGYIFTGWSGDITGTATSVTVTMSGNKTVTANFAVAYTLVVSSTPSAGGTITKTPNATSYAAGTVVTVTVTTNSGYIFTGWSGAASGTATTATVTMSTNKTVIANFAPAYTLTTTVSPAAGGTVTRTPNATSYASGTGVTVTATPASGYVFTGWSGDTTGTAASTTVTMTKNKSVTANFQLSVSTIRIEDDATAATGLCSYDGAISSNSGAGNTKVINLTNSAAKAVTWRVNAPATGTYSLNWRYVNGSSSNSFTMKLLINGVTINAALAFPKTTSSTVFSNTTADVTLAAGNNDIRLESTAAAATADIDWLEITGYSPAPGNCTAARPLSATSTTTSSATVSSTRSTSVLSESTIEKLGIYPNPSSGIINIGFNVNTAGKVNIRVFFADGRLMRDLGTNTFTEGYHLVTQNLGMAKRGLYTIVIRNAKEIPQVYKLIMQ